MGKSTNSMAMFNSYIKLPDGHTWLFPKTGVPPVLTNCATEEKKTEMLGIGSKKLRILTHN
jgi:hypothetical protein